MRVAVLLACALFGTALDAAAADDGLGRLFHTPAERALLDAAREAADLPAAVPGIAVGQPPADAAPQAPVQAAAPVTVNGYVQRERGPSTVWINGEAGTRGEFQAGEGRDLRIGHGVVEMSGASATRARVKPGQVYDPVQGRVVESFERPVAPFPPAP